MPTHRLHVSGEVVLDDREGHDYLPHGHDELRGPEEDEEEVPPAFLHLVRVLEAANGHARHFFRGDLDTQNTEVMGRPERHILEGRHRSDLGIFFIDFGLVYLLKTSQSKQVCQCVNRWLGIVSDAIRLDAEPHGANLFPKGCHASFEVVGKKAAVHAKCFHRFARVYRWLSIRVLNASI